MKKYKKGDGLATVIITIVMIVLVLVIVPAIKGLQKSNTENAQKAANAGGSIVDTAVSISSQKGYDKIK